MFLILGRLNKEKSDDKDTGDKPDLYLTDEGIVFHYPDSNIWIKEEQPDLTNESKGE